MEKFWTFIGLAATKEKAEGCEGYEPSTFSRMLAVPSKSDYVPIEFEKKYTGNKKVCVCVLKMNISAVI